MVAEQANQIVVRLVQPDEANALDHVVADVFDHPVNAHLWETFRRDPRHHLAIATDGALVVGMASAVHYVHPDKPPELWINEVGVAPAYHRRGIGRKLLQALFDQGHALGCTAAWVLTEPDNVAALGLYTNCGGSAENSVMFSFPLSEAS